MKKAMLGAAVKYCGHAVVFPADVFHIGNVCVVKANGNLRIAVSLGRNNRDDHSTGAVRYDTDDDALDAATHHVVDFPGPHVWMPERGVLVVPEKQLLVKTGSRWYR